MNDQEENLETSEETEFEEEVQESAPEEKISVSDALKKALASAIASKKIIFGYNAAIAAMKTGKVSKIIVASDAPVDVTTNIAKYAAMSDVVVESYPGNQRLFGIECKRSHNIIVSAILK